jgi:uncharacterized protein with PIN domain
MKFIVDQPLGALAKWLRFCGFDATLVRLALDAPGSWPPPRPETRILTRQAAAHRLKRPDLMVLAALDPEGQLQEVLHCNDLLAPLNRDQVQGRVSEHVFLHHRRFCECPRCHRVYWPGSHLRGITGTLRDQIAPLEDGDAEPLQE